MPLGQRHLRGRPRASTKYFPHNAAHDGNCSDSTPSHCGTKHLDEGFCFCLRRSVCSTRKNTGISEGVACCRIFRNVFSCLNSDIPRRFRVLRPSAFRFAIAGFALIAVSLQSVEPAYAQVGSPGHQEGSFQSYGPNGAKGAGTSIQAPFLHGSWSSRQPGPNNNGMIVFVWRVRSKRRLPFDQRHPGPAR